MTDPTAFEGYTLIIDRGYVRRGWLRTGSHSPSALGVTMRQSQSIPYAQDIVHPTCAKCGAPMWLTRIEPDEPGSEKRTFECQACQNELVEVIKYR